MSKQSLVWISVLALSLSWRPAVAQDGTAPAPTNPLSGLFTPQPQYPTPQSHDNPTPNVPGANPLGGLFNVQPQYPTAQTPVNPSTATPNGANPLSGFFTAQPQYVTPQTPMNKDGVPVNPGPYGTEAKTDSNKTDDKTDSTKPAEQAAGDKDKEKAAAEDKDKDKSKEKKEKESDKDKEKSKKKQAEKEKEKPAPPMVYNPVQDAIQQMNAGRADQGLVTINKFIKQNPTNPEAHYVAAVINVSLREYTAAINEYQMVLRLVPTSRLGAMAAEGLKKLGGTPPNVPMPALNGHQ